MIEEVGRADVFALNVLASYACRHSGACCTAGWTIPVEGHLLPLIGHDWIEPDAQGACPQYDRPSGLCRIQRDHGETMLPHSCHHFPRRALIDDRGTSLTLSLYCPTAAGLLLDSDDPLQVVSSPPAFPADRTYEGLDARGEWPPLLRPNVLFDVESYSLWERWLVERLGHADHPVDRALDEVAAVAERLRGWHISRGPLLDWTTDVLTSSPALDSSAAARYLQFRGTDAFVKAASSVPPGLERPDLPADYAVQDLAWVAPAWDRLADRVQRYLALKAFASWTAYQSTGIRSLVAELFMTAAVLRVECVRACAAAQRPLDRPLLKEAVRMTDLLLVHLADRDELVPWLGRAELDVPNVVR